MNGPALAGSADSDKSPARPQAAQAPLTAPRGSESPRCCMPHVRPLSGWSARPSELVKHEDPPACRPNASKVARMCANSTS
jgi:hypothetical protein